MVWRVRRPATGLLSGQFVAHPPTHFILGFKVTKKLHSSTIIDNFKRSYFNTFMQDESDPSYSDANQVAVLEVVYGGWWLARDLRGSART